MTVVTPIKDRDRSGSAIEVLLAFAKLGVSCFGGPIAHIGYFRQEFVVRRRWLDEQAYADLVALCQFLPGPASSQIGFSLGLMRAGYLGGLAAWIGFTLPSAIALVLFAYGANALKGEVGSGLLHGLKLVAVAIVAQAVWGMARTLCPDRERASIAVVAALIILLSSSSLATSSTRPLLLVEQIEQQLLVAKRAIFSPILMAPFGFHKSRRQLAGKRRRAVAEGSSLVA